MLSNTLVGLNVLLVVYTPHPKNTLKLGDIAKKINQNGFLMQRGFLKTIILSICVFNNKHFLKNNIFLVVLFSKIYR